VAKHHLGDIDVRDDTILERANRLDAVGRAAQHALGLEPDTHNPTTPPFNRDDGRLVEHDALPLHVHEGIRRPKIDGDVVDRYQTTGIKPIGEFS
jgi:hypothetical protein